MKALMASVVLLISLFGLIGGVGAGDAAIIAESIESDPIDSITQGDITMLFMDMPNVPPQYTPVMVAQAPQAQQPNIERTLGICHPIENRVESKLSAVNTLSPVGDAMTYLENFAHLKFDSYVSVFNAGKMTLLQAPTHGELKLYEGYQAGGYHSSDYTYEGPDSATVLVEIGDYKVKVIYDFVLMQNVPGSGLEGDATDDKSICPNGEIWKVSVNLDANGNSTINSVDYQSSAINASASITATASLITTLEASLLNNFALDASNVTVNFADLPGGAVGQTTGNTITLDSNAAGYSWFIDTTPADNSEYLPTSNPNEWVAKAGSAAAGKMDMLSVLLHEYGHALGIDHSANTYRLSDGPLDSNLFNN